MQINHLHLSVTDVAACAAFFVKHFEFTLLESRGNNGMAIIRGQGDSVVVLMRLPADVDPAMAYPKMFHLGFLVPDSSAVNDKHAELLRVGASDLSELQMERGALRFYVRIPGGLLVEVGHQAAA
jgi:catechol 2,3-dioxygenase-like lactoylglutathione lyase family enzyme